MYIIDLLYLGGIVYSFVGTKSHDNNSKILLPLFRLFEDTLEKN